MCSVGVKPTEVKVREPRSLDRGGEGNQTFVYGDHTQ